VTFTFGDLILIPAPVTSARRETVRLIKRLHQYDVMRANKAPFAFGLEPRVPFLDKAFLDVSMTLDPADKMVLNSC
jgi:asparagine synthase (glutamine-hydrolysing)